MSLGDEIKKVVKGEVDDTSATLEKFSRDASLFRVMPQVVVSPVDAEDVGALVQFVNIQREQAARGVSSLGGGLPPARPLSITARSAGSDMSGGPLNDSIILDMTRHFTRLKELTEI